MTTKFVIVKKCMSHFSYLASAISKTQRGSKIKNVTYVTQITPLWSNLYLYRPVLA